MEKRKLTKETNTEVTNTNTEGTVEQMPAPQTMKYEQTLKLSDKFVSDMYAALDGFSYVEVNELFAAVEQLRNNMPINVLNEIIRRIGSFPYRNVVNLMKTVETRQGDYWQLVNNTATENRDE